MSQVHEFKCDGDWCYQKIEIPSSAKAVALPEGWMHYQIPVQYRKYNLDLIDGNFDVCSPSCFGGVMYAIGTKIRTEEVELTRLRQEAEEEAETKRLADIAALEAAEEEATTYTEITLEP